MWTLPSCAHGEIRAHSLLASESRREYPARTSLVSPLHTGVVSRHARATLNALNLSNLQYVAKILSHVMKTLSQCCMITIRKTFVIAHISVI